MSDFVPRADYEAACRERDRQIDEQERLAEELQKSREFVKTLRKEQEELRKEHEDQKKKLAAGYLKQLAEVSQHWADRYGEAMLRQGQLVERIDKLIEAALPRLGVEPSSRVKQTGCKGCGHDFCEC